MIVALHLRNRRFTFVMEAYESEYLAEAHSQHTIEEQSTPKQQQLVVDVLKENFADENPCAAATRLLCLEEPIEIAQLTRKQVSRLLHLMCKKPAKIFVNEIPVISNETFEVGWQPTDGKTIKNMYYVKFYRMLCIDVDDQTREAVESRLVVFSGDLTFDLYETTKGFHIYCISQPFDYNESLAFKLMQAFQVDELYSRFSIYNGWKIRLTQKSDREGEMMEHYVGRYGDSVDLELAKMVTLKDRLVECVNASSVTEFSDDDLRHRLKSLHL